MNGQERRRRLKIGVAFISEAIADVMTEWETENGTEGLRADQIRQQLGLPHSEGASGLCLGVLKQMSNFDEVEEVHREGNSPLWRLRKN